MEYNENYNYFKPFLQSDEFLLWQGKPGPGKLNTYGRIPLFFAVIWLGFSMFWEWMAVMSGQIIMILFGLPFVLIGLSIVFGAPIKNAKLKGKISYAITDRRLLIREGDKIEIYTADMLPPIQIHMNKNGTGTIFFESTYYTRQGGNQYRCMCALQNLTDVAQAQSALNIMMSGRA